MCSKKTDSDSRKGGSSVVRAKEPLKIFISYSHRDENRRKELETHLKLLQRQGIITTWNYRLIGPGQEWKEHISSNLEQADIILLLVSPDFVASDYCWDKELARALERHEAGTARLVPVIVRDVNWSRAPFSRIQALPRDGKPVKRWPDRDTAWRNVTDGIEALVEDLRKFRV